VVNQDLQEVPLVKIKHLLFTLIVCCLPALCAAQEKQQAQQPTKTESTPSQPSAQHESGMNKEQTQAMQADIQRMRVLLHQMQNNLGAATSAQDPLKHQFELEIEMWQVLLNQMERRTQSASGK
jgi:hypothetical protein